MRKKRHRNIVFTVILFAVALVAIIAIMCCYLASRGYTIKISVTEKKIEVFTTNSNLN